ncbi:hypothetical protein ACS0PU_006427 [Formica fusca]
MPCLQPWPRVQSTFFNNLRNSRNFIGQWILGKQMLTNFRYVLKAAFDDLPYVRWLSRIRAIIVSWRQLTITVINFAVADRCNHDDFQIFIIFHHLITLHGH